MNIRMFLQSIATNMAAIIDILKMYWIIVYVYVQYYTSRSHLSGAAIFKRAYLIREDADSDDSDFVDITGSVKEWMRSYDSLLLSDVSTHDVPENWDAWRLEIRYVHGTRKYRDVYSSDENDGTVLWPPSLPEPGSPAGKIVYASLMNDDTKSDITARVKKYAGPASDFGGRKLRFNDLFPMDDPDELGKSYTSLRIGRMGMSGLIFTEYDVSDNPRLN
jgi:hypothetical protein